MRKFSTLVLAAMLTACNSSEAPQVTTGQAQFSQCAKDTDCKGDRICDAGACVNPAASLVQANAVAAPPSQALPPPTPDNAEENLQEALIAALSQKRGTSERIGTPADAIMGYANAGYVSKQPDSRADYSDYRILKTPVQFMGHTLVAIEEEYMQEYVGCCVSPGMAVIVRVSPNGDDLDTFASNNGCSVGRDTDDYYSTPFIGLPEAAKGTYATLNCKERDLTQKLGTP